MAAGLRETALRDAAAILDGAALVDKEVPRAMINAITDGLADLAVPVVFTLSGHPTWLVQAVPSLVELDVPPPSFRERLDLWTRALPPPLASPEHLEIVASRYAFTGGVIARAAGRAGSTARLRDPDEPRVTLDDLGDAARLMFSHRLGALAQRIPTGFSWDDLVLPKDTSDALREVVRFGRYRAFLLEEWGFAAKLPYGRGISAILAGPPGTGKTMVAQLLAKELGLRPLPDRSRRRSSTSTSARPRRTWRGCSTRPRTSHAVLFFDEADSLFAKRTEVKSSNDRYANLEVNYLLQRMETLRWRHPARDQPRARARRGVQAPRPVHGPVRAPRGGRAPPAVAEHVPAEVPLAPDIDWDLIAKRFEMAGGYIKKAALRAALIAVEAKRAITDLGPRRGRPPRVPRDGPDHLTSARGAGGGARTTIAASTSPGIASAAVTTKNPDQSTASTTLAASGPNTRWPTDASDVSNANWVALTDGEHTDIRNATNAAVPIALARLSTSTAVQKIGKLLPVTASSA